MRTVRRLYFYGVATVSLEVVIWGVIGLLRTILNFTGVGLTTSLLAGSISLVLVGLPVFLIHWSVVQREALKDPDERAGRVRAVFFYGVLLGVLVPAVQNILALANRLWLVLLRLDWEPLIGQGQTWTDNLVAVVINVGAAAYIWNLLRADWQADPPGHSLAEVRRLYRYLWVVYGLGITAFGVQQVLRFILYTPAGLTGGFTNLLADGLALILVGVPLWVLTWNMVQASLSQPGEGDSLLRMVVLYFLSLAGVITVLGAAVLVLSDALSWILGQAQTAGGFLQIISQPVSIGVPLGGVWAYYSQRLRRELEALPERARQAGLRRLYIYILAAFGLVATFIGLQGVLGFIVDMLVNGSLLGGSLAARLAQPLATLAVGLPLWWVNWRPMQREASLSEDAGDHARRSVIRKIYLYLALFAGVIGVMVTAGQLFYLLIRSLLGEPDPNLLDNALNWLKSSLLFAFWLVYHIRTLRQDGRVASKALTARHALFPTLVLDNNDGSFGRAIAGALQKQAPGIPVAVQLVSQGIPPEEQGAARVVVLPSSLVTHPPEAFRLWLNAYQGQRLVVPADEESWLWLGSAARYGRDQAQQVAQAVRQMAEGQPVRFAQPVTGVMVAAYILAGFFLLPVLALLVTLIMSSLGR